MDKKKSVVAGAFAGLTSLVTAARVTAQDDDVASAGNGGTATSSANGGAVSVGDVNSGGNTGNAIGVGDTYGSVAVDGGEAANSTTLDVTANGGTSIADASGGDYNIALPDGAGFLS